ncbi:GAF domain-containing sensor histidine kinase [Antarcticibacterium arcticum]|uniref:GAF domain-containing sensor histidine kinase n=1 Tax=Antarcticibacterium arcticum TaxID=2585771 RepID=UPI0021CF01EF|nr:GAF domain-containing sensor histidine kinase [Antarcticibacterium arcticum]
MLDVICKTTGMGFAAIARVTEDKWVTCTTRDEIAFGLKPGDELKVETTICDEVRRYDEPVFIDNVQLDEHYSCHPTPKMYGFESYVSVPIYKQDGSFFGTLCAIDKKPAVVKSDEVMGMFRLFADLISFHLHTIEKIKTANINLEDERKNSVLREQFIAILGHDLRNPLATIRMSSDILLKFAKEDLVKRQAAMIKSTTFRMEDLIGNILDFARGQFGEGILINKKSNLHDLEDILDQIIAEIETMSPDQNIEHDFQLNKEFSSDANRIGQLLSNLLGNAVIHGDHSRSIKVTATTLNDEFKLSVINGGKKIPESEMEQLFKPFYRKGPGNGKQGLGLGLFISSEIAKAHGGKLSVHSTEEGTSFTFSMPILQS